MHEKFMWLQLFADGGAAGDGGAAPAGEGAATASPGVEPAAAGQETRAERLAKLGVPKEKLNRRAYKEPVQRKAAAPEQVAAADNQEANNPEPNAENTKKPLKEILKDPDYNKEMQNIVSQAKKKSQKAESDLEALAPALTLLAGRFGIEVSDDAPLDAAALAKAIVDDNSFYEEKAISLGVSTDVAKRIVQAEQIKAQQEKQEQQTIEQQMVQKHISKLEQEAVELKKIFPNFDLRTELQNEKFRILTQPGSIMSLEDAFFAVHRREILEANNRQTAIQYANAIQAGQRRPLEGGVAKGQNASVQSFNWHNASKEQREAKKREIRAAAARGEKVYPGR